MKKFFSLTFAFLLMISMVALVGCNGLWDFDDDDDVTVMPVKYSFKGKISLGTAPSAGSVPNLRSALNYSQSNYVGNVYKEGDNTTKKSLNANPIVVDSAGLFTVEFEAYDGTAFYIEFTNATDTNAINLYRYFGSQKKADLESSYVAGSEAEVNEKTTAVGIILQKDSTLTYGEDVSESDPAIFDSNTNTGLAYELYDFVANDDPINETIPVASVTIDQSPSVSLEYGEKTTLTATVTPTYATDKTVTWKVVSGTVATVDPSTGEVEASTTATGSVNITATADGVTSTAVVVNVKSGPVAVKGVTVSPTTATVGVDKTQQLTATVDPSNADDTSVSWSSSNESVATVDSNGLVTGVAEGNATITVTTTDGSFTANSSIEVITGTTIDFGSTTISGQVLPQLIIKIDGVDSSFTTTTTLVDVNGKTWTLAKDDDLTTKYGTLVLIAQSVTLNDFTTAYADFDEISFSSILPSGSKVTLLNQNTDPATELFTSGTL